MDEDIERSITREADGGVTLVEGARVERIAPPVSDVDMDAAAGAFFGAD